MALMFRAKEAVLLVRVSGDRAKEMVHAVRKVSKSVNILRIMGVRFLTTGEDSYKYRNRKD